MSPTVIRPIRAACCTVLGLAACATPPDASSGVAATSRTVGDTTVVTIQGEPALERIGTLEPDLVIAPGIDDTTLFSNVYEMDVDRDGRMWVFDDPSSSILVFGTDGTLQQRIGRAGSGPGEFQDNAGMVTLADGRLAQFDAANGRVSWFTAEGTLEGSMRVPVDYQSANMLVTDRSGALYLRRPVAPPTEGEVIGRLGLVRLNADGTLGDSLAPPDLDITQLRYTAQREGMRSSVRSRYGPNATWAWQPTGGFVVGDGAGYRLHIERPDGTPLRIERILDPVPVRTAELEEEAETIRWSLGRMEPGWTWRGPPLPETKAPLLGVMVDRTGRIWARIAVPSEVIPDAELETPRDSTQPLVRHRMPDVREVFSRDGDLLGRVAIPARATLIEADGDTVWALASDADDLPRVVRYRIVWG